MKKDVLMKAYIVTIVLIFALVVIGQLIGRNALNTQHNDIRSVSLARKEATLSQEISKSALSMEFANTEAKFNTLKQNILVTSRELVQIHNALQVRDGSLGLDKTLNPIEVVELFTDVEIYYQAIINGSNNLINLNWTDAERTKLITIRMSINSILNAETEFMSYIDQIVAEYESQFQSHKTGLGTYELVLFAALLGLLLVQSQLIFKPAINLAGKNFLTANAAFQRLKKSELEIRRSSERQLGINQNLILSQRAVKRKNRQLQESEKELMKRTEAQVKVNNRLIATQAELEEALGRQKSAYEELIKTREAALINEQRLDAAIKGAKDGIWDWNLLTNELYFSPQYKKMLGYEDHEMLNSLSSWESKIHPDQLARSKEIVREYLSGKIDNFEYEFQMQHKDGHYLWILTRGAAIRDSSGKPVRFAGSHTNITERKEFNRKLQQSEDRMRSIAEEQLEANERMMIAERKLNRTLELEKKSKAKLSQTLDHLKATQSQLVQSEKMASLGQLTAGIAHEINNPINFVYNGIDTLKMSFDELMVILDKYNELHDTKNVDEVVAEIKALKAEYQYDELLTDIQELVADIKKGAVRTIEIVKGLRVFSRLDEEELKRANVNEAIDATLILLRNKTKYKLEVKKYYDQTIDEINCFPGQLNQVFMNILNNGIQAIPEDHKDGKLEIYTENQEEHIMIRIKDNGKGMSEQVKKRIFEPFFTTKEVGVGTGLGMSISYGIVEKHGGHIYVNSQEGLGTEFSIQIPKNLLRKEERHTVREGINE